MFDYIFPQNQETLTYLKYFKVRKAKILGNLKFSETERVNISKTLPKFFNKKKFFVLQVLIIMRKRLYRMFI